LVSSRHASGTWGKTSRLRYSEIESFKGTFSVSRFLASGLALLYLYYFTHSNIWKWLSKVPLFRFPETASALINRQTLHQVLGLSAIRYSIYVAQYVAFYKFFGLTSGMGLLAANTSILLVLHSLAPVVPLVDPGVRGSLALWVFASGGENAVAVLWATLSVWILNVALPALTGLLLVWKIPKNEFARSAEQR
jgi:hypothetical protein